MVAEFRIFVDESGTHANDYLIIGMLFVPDHGSLHKKLVEVKDSHSYLNTKTGRKSSAKYKETHVAEFKRQVDVDVVSDWMDVFLTSDAWFRAIVIDWDIWDGKHFGGPFEPAALKKRRAYKKWAEMLLQPEFSRPLPGRLPIRDANLYLDRLVVTYGYEILDELKGALHVWLQGKQALHQIVPAHGLVERCKPGSSAMRCLGGGPLPRASAVD